MRMTTTLAMIFLLTVLPSDLPHALHQDVRVALVRLIKAPPRIGRVTIRHRRETLQRTLCGSVVARLSCEPAERQLWRLRVRIQLCGPFVMSSGFGAPSERFLLAAQKQLCEIERSRLGFGVARCS